MFKWLEKWLTKKVITQYGEKAIRHALTALGLWLTTSEISVCQILPVCKQLGGLITLHIDLITQEALGYLMIVVGLLWSAKEAPAVVVGKEVLKEGKKR